jgi:enolase
MPFLGVVSWQSGAALGQGAGRCQDRGIPRCETVGQAGQAGGWRSRVSARPASRHARAGWDPCARTRPRPLEQSPKLTQVTLFLASSVPPAMSAIKAVRGRMVLDSRGNPTVEADVRTSRGALGRAIVPSGASTGTHEAVELRDGGHPWMGKGVATAVKNVNTVIAKAVKGLDADEQEAVDNAMIELDGSPNKKRLGANAILAVSMATARAAANEEGVPLHQYLNKRGRTLPVPMMNILNGGAHADSNVSIQEFMCVPAGAKGFSQALQMGVEVYHHLKKTLKTAGLATAVGDEGGFAPNLPSNIAALEYIEAAVESAGYRLGKDILLALDVAATELYDTKSKVYDFGEDGQKDANRTIEFYEDMVARFPIASIEDGFAEDDHTGWAAMTKRLGSKIQIVGDDLFVTNPRRLEAGIHQGEANSILVKVNQIGSLTETLDVMAMAKQNGYTQVVSHRSGETEDATISHIAVATEAGQIKTGAPARSDRVAKYNELLRIEERLGSKAKWNGMATFPKSG